jgi:hypothetical protein
LDPTSIGYSPHQAIKRIDLADEVALPKSPNGRIARHSPDRAEPMRHEGHLSPHACRSGCSLAAGVAASNHDDIESPAHVCL